ncbi:MULTISPECIES: DEAD/DEAH box helicase [unclassified Shewanella]|uniref:DEAD/DEAH box helicase n=1 Tax=unclassified Shewanella TaxID=196818 RepID=UPI0039B60063
MKFTLKDYQSDAVRDALSNLKKANRYWHGEADKTAFSLTAVTGAGKTVMAAATFESLFHGNDEFDFEADPTAVVIWFSDDPSLNEQTRFRLMESSDRINHSDMVVVENTFNRPKFEPGKIYFLNTQKLGKNSLLVRGQDQVELEAKAGDLFPETRPDLRAYTIWDTIQNTVEDPELTLYLVLDEAHRGIGKTNREKGTIVQRLINGYSGVPGAPIVWGISATVERFNQAIEAAVKRTKLPDVIVDASKVQESGLIKDIILLDIPDEVGDFDTVLVRRAADKLKECSILWSDYVRNQKDTETVIPLMVLQVPNTPDHKEIGRALGTIFERYPELPVTSVAHVFGDHTTQRFGDFDVPYIEPQRVQDSSWIRILIAKDAISTGWDCPRAEVMISFRSANDKTHITQLLGRMVRSPLARRVPGNERLNSVDCLLPKFNKKTVESVVEALMSGDDTLPATPGRILVNPVEVLPNPEVNDVIWEKFESLPSQTRPQRGAKPAKRLTALAQELADDGLLEGAGSIAHAALHNALDDFRLQYEDKIKIKRDSVMTVDGRTVVADMKGKKKTFNQFWEDADMAVIDDAYRRAARVFTPDVSRTYVEHLARHVTSVEDDPEGFLDAIVEARVTVAGLGLVVEIQDYFDDKANTLVKGWLQEYWNKIKCLSDDRKESYRQIIEMSEEPQDIELIKPEAKFEMTRAKHGNNEYALPTWKRHLLCDEHGNFPSELNDWEHHVLEKESSQPGFLFWYRNPQTPGQSSLGIAYQDAEQHKIMRPDFLFFAEEDGQVVADIVDPHGLHLADALPKLQGLAVYAQVHADSFRRIESVAEVKGKLRVLDMTNENVRAAVKEAQDANSIFMSPLAYDY